MLSVKRVGNGICLWCATQKEGVEVEFADGSMKGFLCKADFWRLMKTRSNGKGKHEESAKKS